MLLPSRAPRPVRSFWGSVSHPLEEGHSVHTRAGGGTTLPDRPGCGHAGRWLRPGGRRREDGGAAWHPPPPGPRGEGDRGGSGKYRGGRGRSSGARTGPALRGGRCHTTRCEAAPGRSPSCVGRGALTAPRGAGAGARAEPQDQPPRSPAASGRPRRISRELSRRSRESAGAEEGDLSGDSGRSGPGWRGEVGGPAGLGRGRGRGPGAGFVQPGGPGSGSGRGCPLRPRLGAAPSVLLRPAGSAPLLALSFPPCSPPPSPLLHSAPRLLVPASPLCPRLPCSQVCLPPPPVLLSI